MKKAIVPFRVSRALLALALVPAALAGAPASGAEHPPAFLVAERAATQHGPASAPSAVPLVPRRTVSPGIAALVEAAEQGHGPAQKKLGAIFDQGAPGTPRDFAESMRWYQKAREQGEEIPTPHTFRAVP